MMQCWDMDPRKRPSFFDLARAFGHIFVQSSRAAGQPTHWHESEEDVTVTPCLANDGRLCRMCASDVRAQTECHGDSPGPEEADAMETSQGGDSHGGDSEPGGMPVDLPQSIPRGDVERAASILIVCHKG